MRCTGPGLDMLKSPSTGLRMHLCTVICQLLKHPEIWFCLSASSVQNVVVPVSLVCSCWLHSAGLGMLLLLTETMLGALLFRTVGYHCELFFGKPFICDKLSSNPCQILQSINCSYVKNQVNVHLRYKMSLRIYACTCTQKSWLEIMWTMNICNSHLKPMGLKTRLHFQDTDRHFLWF